jgi:hypothetical protein
MGRRSFLRGLGTIMALPALEALAPRRVAAAATAPLRMAFLYVPNGVNVHEWFPTGEGSNYQLSNTLKALEPHRSEFSIVGGLAQDKARANGDGGGDHARSYASFLTGVQPKKTAGSDIHLGISVDQIAANKLGHLTKLPSLELSTDGQRSAGKCDSGYSCAYQFNLSWRNETTPLNPEMDPRLVFERLFGLGAASNNPEAKRRRAMQKSILDMVQDDAKALQRTVSGQDKAKLDEYFSAVRDIEQRIERNEKMTKALPKGVQSPSGVPEKYQDHIRMMFDMLVLAFQTDTTRIATFGLAHDGSNRSFAEIGVPDGHHQISHHQDDTEKLRKIALIDQFYIQQLAYFLDRMKTMKEGEHNLLHNSMVVYGGGIRDGNRHNHEDLPIILAGHAGGTFSPGRRILHNGETPMTNLYLTMLDRLGVPAERIGDSTGRLEGV